MQKPRLITSDLDGTLLDPCGQLSERTIAVLRQATEAGIPVVPATSRPARMMMEIEHFTDITGYAVCGNGAVIYDINTDRIVEARQLAAIQLQDIAHALKPVLPGCRFSVERAGSRAVDPGVSHFVIEVDHDHPWIDSATIAAPLAEVLGHSATRLLVNHPDMKSTEMAAIAKEILADAVEITFSYDGGMLEIAAAGVTKASGVARVAEWLGIPASDAIAFGDMPNDLELLNWAGHSVAMANSHPTVLNAATEITGTNSEDGVAQVLERWF